MKMNRGLRRAQRAAVVCVVSALALWVTACGGGGGGGGLFGADLTNDPDALTAADSAGTLSGGLEVVLIGAGLLTKVPLGQLPEEAVQAASSALNELLEGCLTADTIQGDATGLSVTFGAGGCGIPATNVQLAGGFAFQTSATETTDTWSMTFNQFNAAGLAVDGSATVTVEPDTRLQYEMSDLSVVSSSRDIRVDGTGDLVTNSGLDELTFTGQGAVTYNGATYSADLVNVNRHLVSDCYPETGTITLGFTSTSGATVSATITFDDSQLGLDSDDTGQVSVVIDGVTHTAQLPARNCTGF